MYITSARRAYEIADHYRRLGVHVALGGLHVTSLPDEAAQHADTILLGPGEDIWPAFLADLRAGRPGRVYRSRVRTLDGAPPARRDLIRRDRYLVPNSVVVSRGCPHACDFCYKEAFYRGGRSFYTRASTRRSRRSTPCQGGTCSSWMTTCSATLHSPRRCSTASAAWEGMAGGRHGAAVSQPGLLERAVTAGLSSLFVGFETLAPTTSRAHKTHSLAHDYVAAIRRLHDLGVMVNASFVFGMDDDDETVFDRTVDWAIAQGRDGHVPHPDALPRHGAVRAARGRGAHPDAGLGPVRHAPCGVLAGAHVGAGARGGLLARL